MRFRLKWMKDQSILTVLGCTGSSRTSQAGQIDMVSKVVSLYFWDLTHYAEVSFLDAQTKDVSIAALIYTQEQEIFTSLTIEFQVTETGVVEGNVHMTSHHELHGNEEFSFLAYLTTTIAWSFLALVYTVIRLLKKCKLCRKRDQKPMTYSDMSRKHHGA